MMGGIVSDFADSALKLGTAQGRAMKILPEESKTFQGLIDMGRGKVKPGSSSLLGKPISVVGKQSEKFLYGKDYFSNPKGT